MIFRRQLLAAGAIVIALLSSCRNTEPEFVLVTDVVPDVLPGQEVGSYKPITEEQYRNRIILREAMLRHGFKPYDCEWWHFTLENEPYPDTYFNFPIRADISF